MNFLVWSYRYDHVCYNLYMKKIGAAEFKAHCLALMEDVRSTREPLIITKRGKPVAKLVPVESKKDNWIGRLDGVIRSSAILNRPSMGGNPRDPARLARTDLGGGRLEATLKGRGLRDSSRTSRRWLGSVGNNCLRGRLADRVWKGPRIRYGRNLGTSISRGSDDAANHSRDRGPGDTVSGGLSPRPG